MRRRLFVVGTLTCLAACGLDVVGTAPEPTTSEHGTASSAEAGSSGEGGAIVVAVDGGDAADGAPRCTVCSATCPTACGAACSGNNVCLASGVRCANDCNDDCGGRKDCTICGADGKRFTVCGDSTCSVSAFTCPCSVPGDCPDDQDVCSNGRCVRCGYGGPQGGTASLTCRCDGKTCSGTSCGC